MFRVLSYDIAMIAEADAGMGAGCRGRLWVIGGGFLWGQVCIASRGKVKKLCMEVNAGTSADVSIRALWGSGGLESP